jgi:hypothetical protein
MQPEPGHELCKFASELCKFTTEAVTAWAAVVALLLATLAAAIAWLQVRETRNSEKEADAQESFRSYLQLCLNNPQLAYPDYQEIKKDDLERKKYEWFVASLLAASEKIIASVKNDQRWIDTIKLNVGYHKEFLSDKTALKESEFNTYDPRLQKLVRAATGRPP